MKFSGESVYKLLDYFYIHDHKIVRITHYPRKSVAQYLVLSGKFVYYCFKTKQRKISKYIYIFFTIYLKLYSSSNQNAVSK